MEETDVPEPRDGEVLIETAYSCVSPGTELRCLSGQQAGAPPWPFVPGYALSGRIVTRGVSVTLTEGARVFCGGTAHCRHARLWGGHIGYAVVPAEKVFLIPEGVNLREATLAKLAAITLRGVRLSRPQAWESVAVVGLGPVGHLAARLHAVSGARVVGVDTVPERAEALRRAGIEAVSSPPDGLAEAVRALLPNGADVVVDATGAVAAARQAVLLAHDIPWDDTPVTPSRYVIQGSYAADLSLPYDEAFQKELTVHFARDVRPDDLRTVFDLLQRGRLSLDGILGEASLPAQAPQMYADLRARKSDLLTVAFRWNGADQN